MAYSIRVLKRNNDIFLIIWRSVDRRRAIINSDRNVWPLADKDVLLDKSPIRAANSESETTWRFKYDLSPSSTDVYQCLILNIVGAVGMILLIEIKYIKQNIV